MDTGYQNFNLVRPKLTRQHPVMLNDQQAIIFKKAQVIGESGLPWRGWREGSDAGWRTKGSKRRGE